MGKLPLQCTIFCWINVHALIWGQVNVRDGH